MDNTNLPASWEWRKKQDGYWSGWMPLVPPDMDARSLSKTDQDNYELRPLYTSPSICKSEVKRLAIQMNLFDNKMTQDVLIEAKSNILWLKRRLPKAYESPPHIDRCLDAIEKHLKGMQIE